MPSRAYTPNQGRSPAGRRRVTQERRIAMPERVDLIRATGCALERLRVLAFATRSAVLASGRLPEHLLETTQRRLSRPSARPLSSSCVT